MRAAGVDHAAEGARVAVFAPDPSLDRRVPGSLPHLHLGVERAAFGTEDDLHLLDRGRAVRTGAEGATLHED